MENSLVKYTDEARIAKLSNPVLIQAAADLAVSGTALAKSLSDIAKSLGRVKIEIDKAGKDGVDGYTSVRDYAEQLFGINRSQAYSLATTGERFYIPAEKTPKSIGEYRKAHPDVKTDDETFKKLMENEAAFNDFVNATPVSNMAELANVDRETLMNAVASGEISAKSTQKELREFRNSLKDEEHGAKVLPMYMARAYIGVDFRIDFEQPKDVESIIGALKERFGERPAYKGLDIVERGGTKVKRIVCYTEKAVALVDLYPVPKQPKKSAKKSNPFTGMTREEAEAMLKAAFGSEG